MTAMASTSRQSKSTAMASKAKAALEAGETFDAERAALKAIAAARHEHAYARMAEIMPTLLEARMHRVALALKTNRIITLTEPVSEDVKAQMGCYIVQPPQVAADARRLRMAGFEQNVPVVVLCREPLTQVKLLPIVALGPGATVRTKVRPPKNMNVPDMSWFTQALDALGTFAVETLDPALTAERRVDALIDRLDAVPEHEGLHHALQQACMDAQQEYDRTKAAKAERKASQSAKDRPAGGGRAEDDSDSNGDDDATDADSL